MLDNRCLALLDIINTQCTGGGYKVFEFSFLASLMPSYYQADSTCVHECLKQLVLYDYVSVKYEDESEVCVSPLPKGRLIFEEKIDQEIEKIRSEKRYFLYAFLGAVVLYYFCARWQDVLNKIENKVMRIIYCECINKSALLISPTDLNKMVGINGLSVSKLEKTVTDLNSDGYFNLVYSDRRGERVYCIELTEKGKGYLRSSKVFKRNLIFRFSLTVVLALLSFLIGLILKAVF